MNPIRAKPLHGIRILDLTRLLPGPVATMHLADLGADVVKIEDTGVGDYARSMGPMQGDTAYLFQVVNRNKRSLCLDLKQHEGVEVFLRLARDADIIVEGFRPGVVDKLGVGYAAVAALNPRVVYCAITGYGQDGPYRDRAGHDINYIGYAGVLDQIGMADDAPTLPNFQIGDLLGGALTPLIGILAALIDARSSGRGRYVDVAMTDSVLAHAIFPLLGVLARGAAPPRGGDLLSGGVPCYGVYGTADDRFMAVGALEPKFWHMLCDTLGRPDLKPYGQATGTDGERVRRELQHLFAKRTLAEWMQLFENVDCCVTPILRLDESLGNEQIVARGMMVDVGGVRQFAPPFKLSEFEFDAPRPAPRTGADSESILCEAGFSADEIARLRAQRVIWQSLAE